MTEDELIAEDEKRRIAALHKTAPETIWLQIDPEAEQFDGWDAQTWCSDQINDTDLKYVRTDVVEELRQQLAERDAYVAELKRQLYAALFEPVLMSDWRKLEQERDELREHVKLLRDALLVVDAAAKNADVLINFESIRLLLADMEPK